jgi:thiol-disulfide isomerase/thioredoxin
MRVVLGLAVLAFGTCRAGSAPPSEPEAEQPELAATDPATEKTGDPAPDDAAVDAATQEEPDPAPGDAGDEPATNDVPTPPDPPADVADAPASDEPAAPAPAFALPKRVFNKVDAKCGKDKGVGSKLKSFKLTTPAGKAINHRSYGNRVLLVNFWGTWCKPCLEELPEFDRLYRRYRKHGLVVVAIATDAEPEPVQAFVKSRKLSTRVLIGGEDYAGQYGAPTFPFTYVVDPKGVIRGSYHGYKPECLGKLESDIREQLEARADKKK